MISASFSLFFFFKQKTAYEMRISDWSSDVCSSDLGVRRAGYTTSGSPASLSITRTMRNSLSRRIALKRPSSSELEALEAEIARQEELEDRDEAALDVLRAQRDALLARQRRISYIDRSEERRCGKEVLRQCKARWLPCN